MNLVRRTQPPTAEAGFTAVEVLVTLFVAVGFIIVLNTLSITIIRASTAAQNQASAQALAYANLRRFAYAGATPTWFACDASDDHTKTSTALDAAQGQVLDSGSLDKTQSTLPQPVTYRITAAAPYGCTGAAKPPVLLRSTVTYGSGGAQITASQATYVGY